jgi:glutamate-1-semialdehyde 2,1-aminomutase
MTQDSLRPSGLQHRPQDRPQDRIIFDRLLRDFVPDDPFDFHAHLYRVQDMERGSQAVAGDDEVGLSFYRQQMTAWMGDRAPKDGMFFAMPTQNADVAAANEFCVAETSQSTRSRALLMIAPGDDPAATESLVEKHCGLVAGFKVYHVFADRPDTMNATIEEYIPEWAWELADRHSLLLMLHIVKPLALADPENQRSLRRICLQYPGARVVLAHAARGFCGRHTVDSIESLSGLDNVLFDTSAICEPAPLLSILQKFGPRRLLYGSDFPVSNLQGRCSSVGDGFFWFYEDNVDWSNSATGSQSLVGIESLLALRQACKLAHLTEEDIQCVFRTNAEQALNLDAGKEPQGQNRYAQAQRILPGGTQLLSKRPEMIAPGQWPPYFSEARGVQIVDSDGREFTDMSMMSVGACLLGYADPDVNTAVSRRVMLGSMSTLNSPDEVEFAELMLEIHPWAGMVSYARGGGEALAIAARIARASTGRSKIAFCGYHGWQDWYLAANLSSAVDDDPLAGHLLAGLNPAGVPKELAGTALPFKYNCLDELDAILKREGDDLAAIFMEPTRSQLPDPGFLEGVRERADSCGAVLAFDEVSVGWRLCLGGAHLMFGIQPDMAIFSKATANGYPMAAILGTEPVMQASQKSFISSTMWTDGIGSAAALATVRKHQQHDVPAHVATIGNHFRQGMKENAARHGVEISFQGHPAMSILSFKHDNALALQTLLTVRMLDRGFLVDSGIYPSLAHEKRHVDACVAAADDVFAEIGEAIRLKDIASRLPSPTRHTKFQRLA